MSRRKPADEWGIIINQQAEFQKRREEEEKDRIQQEKENYRRDLEYQSYLRDLAKEQERKQRDYDALSVEAQIKAFKEQESKRKDQESQQKKSLHNVYDQHSQSQIQRQAFEKTQKLQEEQVHLARIQAQIAEDERKRKEAQDKATRDEEEILNIRRYQGQVKKQMEYNEKLYDIELARARKENEEQKEREYREYYNRISEKQAKKQHMYAELVGEKDQYKQSQVNQWIDQGYQWHLKSQKEKEEYEQTQRLKQKSNMNEALQQQLDQKEYGKQLQREEQKRQAELVQQRIEDQRQAEIEKANLRKVQQNNYRDFLSNQVAVTNDVRDGAYKLSEPERRMNKIALRGYEETPRSQLQRNATNMLRSSSNSTLQSLHHDENFKKFLDVQMSPNMSGSSGKIRNNSMLDLDMKPAGRPTRASFSDPKYEPLHN